MNFALVVAAGNGTRVESADLPKQFILIKDKPLLIYSLETFQANKDVDAIIVVTNCSYIKQVQDWCDKYQLDKVRAVISGGLTRQESVSNGLNFIKSQSNDLDNDIVLIHDAARPLVSQEIISNNVEACRKYDATCTAIKVKDTVASSTDSINMSNVVDRSKLYQCQTPQSFKLSLILKAHAQGIFDNATDDAQLVLALGKDVFFVEGTSLNFKVTTDSDLVLLKSLVK